jgi:hypothetical protein
MGKPNRQSASPKMITRYCPACGLLVAASANPRMIDIAQRAHSCPQSLAFGRPGSKKLG